MKRRDFLKVASGAAGGAAAVGAASARSGGDPAATGATLLQENNTTTTAGNGTATGNQSGNQTGAGGGGGLPGAGTTKTVDLVDYAFNPGTDNPLEIKPGTTVKFVWKTGGHNIVVTKQPDGADWQGHEPIEDQGFTYTHTFTVKGEYDFHCQPHKSLGMVATMKVTDNPSTPAAGQATIDPEEMGVPFQAHYVGIAAITGLIVSLVFTFYTLKYGESPNASSPNRKR